MLKFNKHKAMNERIIDRKLFVDLAKEVGLNASHIEAMGEMRHCCRQLPVPFPADY